jgi:hypothetical protein
VAVLVVAVLLALAGARDAWGQPVSVELPAEATPAEPFEVVAAVAPGEDVAQVELLYRSASAPEVQAVPMAPLGGGRHRGVVAGPHVVPPGVEIVIRLRDRKGDARLHFRTPPDQPYLVQVGEAAAATVPSPVTEVVPAPGTSVVGRRPTLVVRVSPEAPPPAPGQVSIAIDGVDMTSLLEFAGTELRLRPATALTPGAHEAVVTVVDAAGRPTEPVAWSFTVRDYAAVQEGSLAAALSGTYEYATNKLVTTDPRWTVTGNLQVDGRVAEGGLTATLLANVRLLEQHPGNPPDERQDVDLASHLFTVLYGRGLFQGRLELGDVAVTETWLTTGFSFARRGVQFVGTAHEAELRLFATSFTPLLGFHNFTGLDNANRRVQGGSLAYGVLGERFRVKLTVVDGENTSAQALGDSAAGLLMGAPVQGLQAYNIGSMEGGIRARTYSVSATSRLLDGRLRAEGEVARSRRQLFTAPEFGAVPDETSDDADGAWRARLEGDLGPVRAGVEHRRVGRDFASAANPTLVSDRQESEVDLATSLGPTSWQLRLSRAQDNVRNTFALPRTTEWRAAPSVTLGLPDLPSLTLSYMLSEQTTARRLQFPALGAPVFEQPQRLVTEGGSASLSYATPTWFATVAPGYFTQRSYVPHRSTDTRSLTVAAGVTPFSWLTVSPSYTFTRTRDFDTHATTDTHVPTLTGRVELVPGWVTADTQTSWVVTSDNKATVDTTTLATLGRLSLSLARLFPGGIAPAISTRATYTRTLDRFVATNRREDYGVFVIFDIFAPATLLPQLGLGGSPEPGPVVGAGAPAPGAAPGFGSSSLFGLRY